MTTVLTQIELILKLQGDRGWETWLAQDTRPGYDHSSMVRATGFLPDIAQHAQIRGILDYESAVAVQLRHPGIVPTIKAGLDSNYWFAAELVAGESLGDVVDQLRERGYPTLTVPLTLAIGSMMCDALHAAHTSKNAAGWSLNAVHGGIDLDVVVLTYEGVVKVREFGVAKARRQAWLSRVGGLGERRVRYVSPEEVRGRPADPRSDVYGVGAVLYELLTGQSPAEGSDPLSAVTAGVATPPSAYNAKVTPQLDVIVMRALAVDPNDRFENCDHLRQQLLRLAADPSMALQRVPRILTQLFPGHQELWAQVRQYERRRDWREVHATLQRLLIEVSEPTAMRSVPVDLDATLQAGDVPAAVEAEVSQTLPTGVPSVVEDTNPAHVAMTHTAYKPTPMPSTQQRVASAEPTPMFEPAAYQAPEPQPQQDPGAVEPQAAPAAPAPSTDFVSLPEDGDHDDDEPFVEPFDVAELVDAPELQPKNAATKPVLEIIRTANGRALDIAVLSSPLRGYSRQQGALKARLAGGKATVKMAKPLTGWVRRGRNPREDVPADLTLQLGSGDAAELRDGDVIYHLRVFNPPIPPKSDRQLVSAADVKIYAVAVALSLVVHGVGGLATLLTSYLGVELTVQTPEQAEVFAEGKLPQDEKKPVEKPKPEPKPVTPKPKRIEPKPSSDPTEAQAKIPKAVRQQLDKRLRNTNVSKTEDKAENLIASLTTPVKGDGATIKDVVTNIDAVARPGARGAAFNVTGTLGNLPEGGVNIATSSGSHRIGDIGGSVATDVGKLDKREGSGKVRGKARAVKALSKVKGSLTQSEVYDVIQKHTGQIQACYERELNKNPGLAGKLTFLWIVKTNGAVGSVKENNNTLGNAAVSKCVSGVIKKMKFPRPKGGEVEVVFPWIFKAG